MLCRLPAAHLRVMSCALAVPCTCACRAICICKKDMLKLGEKITLHAIARFKGLQQLLPCHELIRKVWKGNLCCCCCVSLS